MKLFNFYSYCLKFASFILIILGVYVAFFKNTPLFIPFDFLIDPVFWKNGIKDQGTVLFKGFIYSIYGVTILIWGIQLLFITQFGFQKKENWAWWGILISTLVWYTIDAGFSTYYKVCYNTLANTLFLILLILPLIMTRSVFKKV